MQAVHGGSTGNGAIRLQKMLGWEDLMIPVPQNKMICVALLADGSAAFECKPSLRFASSGLLSSLQESPDAGAVAFSLHLSHHVLCFKSTMFNGFGTKAHNFMSDAISLCW